jgi:hypothetical protein
MQRTHLNIVAHTPKSSAEDTEPFIFVIIADPQIGLLGGCDGWDEDIRIVNKGIDAINALQPVPRFCAILGDLAHHHPECEPGVADCASIFEKQKEDFKKCVARIRTDVPVVLVPGNHDGKYSSVLPRLSWKASQFEDICRLTLTQLQPSSPSQSETHQPLTLCKRT